MRILHMISSPAAGGAEIYVRDLSKSLASKGNEVHVLFMYFPDDLGHDCSFATDFINDLHSSGVKTHFLGKKYRLNFLSGWLGLRRYVRRNKIQVLHSHMKYGVMCAAFLPVPVVYTHHSIAAGAGKMWFLLSRLIVDKYIGISSICSRALKSLVGDSVHTIENGVNRNRLNPFLRQYSPDLGPLKCVMVGRIRPEKNYSLLLHALAFMSDVAQSKIEVNIVGEGADEAMSALRAKIDDSGFSTSVHLKGNQIDIPSFLSDAHVFLMTSTVEGMPIALIEAAMSGLPCIVTDVGGCSEVINKCCNGIIIRSGDAQGLSQAIMTLFKEPGYVRRFSQSALDHSDIYSMELSVFKHTQLYERCIASC